MKNPHNDGTDITGTRPEEVVGSDSDWTTSTSSPEDADSDEDDEFDDDDEGDDEGDDEAEEVDA
jgi:hypothetical protein